jgi:hypothetical protein
MAFQVIYPDTLLRFNVSSAPSINVAVNASSIVVANAGNISSHIYANEISVDNTTNNTKSIMDDGSVYCADTDTGTSARIYQQGQLLINETLPVNSFMNASGISFVNAGSTARLSTLDGVTLSTGLFKPAKLIDSSNSSGASNQVLSAGSGSSLSWVTPPFVGTATSNLSMSTYNVNFNSGSGFTSRMMGSSLNFSNSGTTSANLTSTLLKMGDSNLTNSYSEISQESILTSNGTLLRGVYLDSAGFGQFNGQATSEDPANRTVINPLSIDFITDITGSSSTVSLSTTDGISIQSGPFKPTKILDGSNSSGAPNQVLSAGAGGELSWITATSGVTPTSDIDMSTYNLSWSGGLKLNDDGAGNLKINTLLNASNRTFAQKYLPINVLISGTPTVAYLQLYI